MRATTALLIFALVFPTMTGCSAGVLTKAAEIAAIGTFMAEAVETFESRRTAALEQVDEATKVVENELSKNKPNFVKSAERWAQEWQEVTAKVKDLETKLADLSSASEKYFTELDTVVGSMENPETKASELQKNAQLRESWMKVYQQAQKDIEAVKLTIRDGNDFEKVLLAAILREKLEANIGEAKAISTRARELLTDLEKLTIEGRKLSR